MISKAIIIEGDNISRVKSLISRKLNEKGFKQSEISSFLHITQPMVSKYLMQEESDEYLEDFADSIIGIIERQLNINFSIAITEDKIPSESNYFISTKEHILTNEKSVAIQNINMAIEMLRGKDLSRILPNVKINIAMAIRNPNSREDIAAIPGGLIIVNNYLRMYNEPEFGTSKHLSQILLYAMKLNKSIFSVMNIKFNREILQELKRQKFLYYFLKDNYTLAPKKRDFDALVHKGLFGIEPSCYVFGFNAVASVEKCCKLL